MKLQAENKKQMRRVSLNDINDNMVLARPIYQGPRLILERGVNSLTRYTQQLNNLGIFSVYVEDELSMGIHIPDAVCQETREKCNTAITTVFQKLKQQGNFDSAILDDMIQTLLDDIFSREDILSSLSQISSIDDGTMVHSVNVTIYCLLIGKRMNLSREQLKVIAEGAILHDIGKIQLDESVLLKNTSLTQEEYSHVKEHSAFGYKLLEGNKSISEEAKLIVLQHHERLDGSGYPGGLKNDEIHPYAQIAAIADMFDALTTERCYRKSMSNYKTYNILTKDAANGKLNAEMLPFLLEHIAIYPNGIIVNLSDGTHGIVKAQNPGQPFRPVIRVINDTLGIDNITLYDMDLSKRLDIEILE